MCTQINTHTQVPEYRQPQEHTDTWVHLYSSSMTHLVQSSGGGVLAIEIVVLLIQDTLHRTLDPHAQNAAVKKWPN